MNETAAEIIVALDGGERLSMPLSWLTGKQQISIRKSIIAIRG